MEHSEPHISARRAGWWRYGLLILGLLVAGYVAYMLMLQARVSSLVGRIRDAGQPVTLDELNAWYEAVPAGETNAAEGFMRAISMIIDDQALEARTEIFGTHDTPPDPDDVMAAMTALVALNRAALDQAHAAAGAGQSRWPVDFRGGISLELPHLGKSRRLARMLNVEMLVAAGRGDTDVVLRAIHTITALAESFRDEPILISQLVRTSIHALGLYAAAEALPKCEVPREAWIDLSRRWWAASGREPMVRAMVGERALGHDCFINLNRYVRLHRTGWGTTSSSLKWTSDSVWENPLLLWAYRLSGAKQMDHALYLRAMERAVEEAAKIDGWRRGGADALFSSAPVWCALSREMGMTTGVGLKTHAQIATRLQAAASVAAAMAYTLNTGSPPAALADLVPDYLPELPMDPFAPTSPLVLKVTDDKLTVYGVGADSTDHGGTVVNADGQEMQPGTDIVFQVPRQPR